MCCFRRGERRKNTKSAIQGSALGSRFLFQGHPLSFRNFKSISNLDSNTPHKARALAVSEDSGYHGPPFQLFVGIPVFLKVRFVFELRPLQHLRRPHQGEEEREGEESEEGEAHPC